MLDKVKAYLKHLELACSYAEDIAEELVKALKPIIPDIKYSIGWEEGGIDEICFYSKTRNIVAKSESEGLTVSLRELIEEAIPELQGHVDTPFGVYLTKEEAEQAKSILSKLREGLK